MYSSDSRTRKSRGSKDFADKFRGVFQHQSIRKTQYLNTHASQVLVLRAVFADLARLRVHAAVKFNGQPTLKAIEIDDVPLNRNLTSEFQAQAPAAQQVPSRFFGLRLIVTQFTNSSGWHAHVQATLSADSERPEVTPHPSVSRRTPSPLGEGCYSMRAVARPAHRPASSGTPQFGRSAHR